MLKAFSVFGLGIIFYLISPRLQSDVHTALAGGVMFMDRNSPYSYGMGGVLVLCTLVYSFYRGSQAR